MILWKFEHDETWNFELEKVKTFFDTCLISHFLNFITHQATRNVCWLFRIWKFHNVDVYENFIGNMKLTFGISVNKKIGEFC